MDQAQSGSRATGTLPRLSRLPKILPRASHDNLRLANTSQFHDPIKTSSLPRPSSRSSTSRTVASVPLGENLNRSVKERYAWSSTTHSQTRSRSPVRDALQAANATLDTTPPSSGSHLIIHEDGNENAFVDEKNPVDSVERGVLLNERRKPRLSLSERTVETLSRISPSPSPTRRRSSMATHDGTMGPPLRPASRMTESQPTFASARSPSPSKSTFRPPGRSSPSREPEQPAITSPGFIYTPPRAFVKGSSSRLAKSATTSGRMVTDHPEQGPRQASSTRKLPYPSKTMRSKSTTPNCPPVASKSRASAALEELFKEPEAVTANVGLTHRPRAVLGSQLTDQKTTASSPAPRITTLHRKAKPIDSSSSEPGKETTSNTPLKPASSKSSAALRNTIAKAKAAKQAGALPKTGSGVELQGCDGQSPWLGADSSHSDPGQGLLRKRLQTAVISGSLSLAAMNLSLIPHEVMNMYETTTGSISWSEMVDLTKLNVADNKLELIGEDVFPDWSVEEMYNDDEKTNQFAGLELLDLHNNLLPSIPVGLRRMERLKTLNLNGNKLTNQILTIIWQVPNLQNLHLAHNDLTGVINLSTIGTEQLRKLDLSNNQLTGIELADGQGTTLQSLNISSNLLATIPWPALALSELVELKASGNRLHGNAFEDLQGGFRQLVDLDLSHNAISTLGSVFSALASLRTCALSGNNISYIPDMSELQRLTTFQVSENKLQEIPSSMYSLQCLRNVDLSMNNITLIQPQIGNMENLSMLNMAGNPLRERKHLSMTTGDLKLDMRKRLEPASESNTSPDDPVGAALNSTAQAVAKSGGSYAFHVVNGVLDLSAHGLTSVDLATIDFGTSSQPVHTLRLMNNDLTALPEELLRHPALATSLRSLDISHNPRLHSIRYITSEIHLPSLQNLYVVSTGLTSLDALTTNLKAPSLAEMNISCHRLTGAVPNVRRWYPSCTTLLASDNWFSTVDVASVEGLEVLDIRNNQIECLPPAIGLLGNHGGKREAGRLRVLEVAGNVFRVPRINVVEKGTEAVLKDLRRMVSLPAVLEEWQGEI